MLFNSFDFFVFFPVVTILYFVLPHRYRGGLLLIASCLFYMAFIPVYVLILIALIIIDYLLGIQIEEAPKAQKKHFLIFSILATCTVLFIFKYFNFFNANAQALARLIGWNYPLAALQVILPIGLSFHTFQSLAYIIEVYKGRQKAERNFWIYALYVMFYPQLVAGPIERPGNLLRQFYDKHGFDYQRVTDGLKLMAWGMFKKVVIADRLAVYVNQVYGHPAEFSGPALALATFFFAFQIYCDFSGYADIAIGAAQVMGFRLMDNFNRPYAAKSISEFWKRWHISLSSWFRDYLYIPLGGNRCGRWRWQFNILVTFLVSGLWHGANWTYVIWGALNGFYLLFAVWTEHVRAAVREKIGLARHAGLLKAWQVAVTFLLICFSWIFFRSQNLQDALYIVTQLPHGWEQVRLSKQAFNVVFGLPLAKFLFSGGLIVLLIMVHMLQKHGSIRRMLQGKPAWVRWSFYYLLVLGMVFESVQGKNPFIYFQF